MPNRTDGGCGLCHGSGFRIAFEVIERASGGSERRFTIVPHGRDVASVCTEGIALRERYAAVGGRVVDTTAPCVCMLGRHYATYGGSC